MVKNVCIFASSSDNLESSYYNDAANLGTVLGKNKYAIVYGGGNLGLMYACAFAAVKNGSKLIGVMPKKLYDYGVGNPNECDEFHLTSGMRERKAKMDQLSDAIIALPGGLGTLEELAEMIVQKQLGYNNKPIILYNVNGFYNTLITFFYEIINKKFAKLDTSNLYYVAETPQQVVDYISAYDSSKLCSSGKF